MLEEYLNVWKEKSDELQWVCEKFKNVEIDTHQLEILCDCILRIETEIFRARIKLEREINYRRFQ